MHLPINVKSPNNISKWQMGFNSAFKGLIYPRPKNRWKDDVKSNITRSKITNWKDCIRNRIKWKKLVEKAKTSKKEKEEEEEKRRKEEEKKEEKKKKMKEKNSMTNCTPISL